MKRHAFRLSVTLLLAAGALRATPITGVTLEDPPLVKPAAIVRLDLGNGLFWEGPEMTPEEWNTRLQATPPPAGFDWTPGSLTAPETTTPTPEPSTFFLLAAGIAAGIAWRRRP